MSDFNSGLPIRTESNGDVVAKIVDGTITSQALGVDAAGKIIVKLDDAAGTGLTSQANGSQQALDVGVNVAGVQVDPRQIRALTATDVVTADQGSANTATNGWPVKPTDGTNSQSYTASGEAKVDMTSSFEDHNFGAVGANTLRTAAQVGNATGAADYNNGATGAQTLRVAANLAVAGANVSLTNPVPVTINTISGAEVSDYKDASATAAAGSDNHDYTVTAAKTLYLSQVIGAASGKAKMMVSVETGVASGVFTAKFVQFNSTAAPNMQIALEDAITVAAGIRVRVTMSNLDNQAQDLYSTICGHEI